MAISITLPGTRLFAFSPSKLSLTGATAGQQIDFTFNGFSATRYADSSGNLIFPLAKALKSAWATTDVGDVEPASPADPNSATKLMKTITLDVKSGGSHVGASPYTITAIWGALQVGETEPTTDTIYRFGDLPLSVIQNIGSDTWVNGSGAAGDLIGKDFFLDTDYTKIEFKTGSTVHKTITIQDVDYCSTDTVYLRWVDSLGQYKYFGFILGASQSKSKAGDVFNRELLDLSSTTNGLYKSQTQLIDIEADSVQLLSVPTATYEQQQHIKTLETSVKCWKYLGSDKWVEVIAAVKPIVLDERFKSNQAIELEITLPKLYLQTL